MANRALEAITIISGGDGPSIQLVSDGHGGWVLKRVPGWNPELIAELANSLTVVSAASKLKTAGLAEKLINSVGGLVETQLGEHAGGAAHVFVMGA
jgi:hypothetical protein